MAERDSFSGTSMAVRCYESHPVIKLGEGKLYGGSASHPVIKTADVYVSLQHGSTSGKISDPWDTEKSVVEVQYSITDMHAPSNVARFKAMVTWLCTQLQNGKTVHVGCVGGHGRTGVVVSAIVAEMTDKKNVIQWVRKNYCDRAVESKDQIKFLMKHYDVAEVEPTKDFSTKYSGGNGDSKWSSIMSLPSFVKSSKPSVESDWKGTTVKKIPESVTSTTRAFPPMPSSRSLWKAKKQKK